ncbi:MAG: acyl transferase [Oceanihabitans sp.]
MVNTNQIFNITSNVEFKNVALQVFKYQFENNVVYRSFCDLLYVHPSTVNTIAEIPFLPISFFKTHKIVSNSNAVSQVFSSSGTTGSIKSKHFVTNTSIYKSSFQKGFQQFFGSISNYTILALLPNYLERNDSSLVYMVKNLIDASKQPDSGFYLDNLLELKETLIRLDKAGKKVLLIGVSFALLDLVENHTFQLNHTIVMETGGMKGRRKELIREELHDILKKGFGVAKIHSEYGMTELLSQAYSLGDGVFECPKWMQVFTRETEDALVLQASGKTGGLNIIDLVNINSCSFIATQDLGKVNTNGTFNVLGRFDTSDIRGCNLMVI